MHIAQVLAELWVEIHRPESLAFGVAVRADGQLLVVPVHIRPAQTQGLRHSPSAEAHEPHEVSKLLAILGDAQGGCTEDI